MKMTLIKGWRTWWRWWSTYGLPFNFYYEVVIGYKAPWDSYNKAMIAIRIFKIGKQ